MLETIGIILNINWMLTKVQVVWEVFFDCLLVFIVLLYSHTNFSLRQTYFVFIYLFYIPAAASPHSSFPVPLPHPPSLPNYLLFLGPIILIGRKSLRSERDRRSWDVCTRAGTMLDPGKWPQCSPRSVSYVMGTINHFLSHCHGILLYWSRARSPEI